MDANDNLTEALADVRTAMESAATAAVEKAAEEFDFDPAIEAATENYDFEKAIEYAVENFNFDDAVETAVRDFDFSDYASDAVKEAAEDYDYSDCVSDLVKTEMEANLDDLEEKLITPISLELHSLGELVTELQNRIRELEAARISARVVKVVSYAKAKLNADWNWIRGLFGK